MGLRTGIALNMRATRATDIGKIAYRRASQSTDRTTITMARSSAMSSCRPFDCTHR
jgi:hypothetical protein